MATTTAKNKQEVDSMDRKERLYDSLQYSYGKKGEKISQEYDKARSQADRQALSRGMQRSSYNAQTLANMDKQKIDALDDNESAMIADYENRLADIEAQDLAADQWERQFAEGQRQYDTSLAFQQAEADRAQANTEWNQNFQTRQYADSREDTAWNKAFQTQQYNDSRADTAWNQAFQTQQANISNNQWEREFERSGQSTSQQIAMSYLSQIASNGGDPSDELLRQAGLSRDDYNAMKAQIVASGGSYGGYGGSGNGGAASGAGNGILGGLSGIGGYGLTDASFNSDIYGLGGTSSTDALNKGTSSKDYDKLRGTSPYGGRVKNNNYIV